MRTRACLIPNLDGEIRKVKKKQHDKCMIKIQYDFNEKKKKKL
jgi:hypothetical protein